MLEVYRHRHVSWSERLAALHDDFEQLFEATEKDLFTRAALIVAKNKADHDFHHGEIGVKAHNKINQTIDLTLMKSVDSSHSVENFSVDKLASIPLFSGLSDDVLKVLSAHAYNVTYLQGDIIIGEGDKGDALYIISHGVAEACRRVGAHNSKVLGELKQGDFFGELALLSDHQRTATVTAKSAMSLQRLTRTDVVKVAGLHAEVKKRLEQVRDERLAEG